MAYLHSIQVGMPTTRGDEKATDSMEQVWHSGFVKTPISDHVHVGLTNLEGDGQADLRVHGGVDKAVLAYAFAHYSKWQAELGIESIGPGGFGENLTIRDVDEASVCIGDVWSVGEVKLQVTQPRQPCWKLARRWQRSDLPKRVIQTGRSGWYFRVLKVGEIQAGMSITRERNPHPTWTIQHANEIYYDKSADMNTLQELIEIPELASAWRNDLMKRLELGE